jgi:hypothetical protein
MAIGLEDGREACLNACRMSIEHDKQSMSQQQQFATPQNFQSTKPLHSQIQVSDTRPERRRNTDLIKSQ